jgi:hypothetical protein
MLLDAGGGTIDAITYTIDKDIPLRLKTEEVEPGGKSDAFQAETPPLTAVTRCNLWVEFYQ